MSNERFERALHVAWDTFWMTFAEHYPECKTGDLSPETTQALYDASRRAGLEWVAFNHPATKENEDDKA